MRRVEESMEHTYFTIRMYAHCVDTDQDHKKQERNKPRHSVRHCKVNCETVVPEAAETTRLNHSYESRSRKVEKSIGSCKVSMSMLRRRAPHGNQLRGRECISF